MAHAEFTAPDNRRAAINCLLVFSQWDQIFKDPMTTMAAIDRLAYHSIILGCDGASQRIRRAGGKAPAPDAE